MSHSKRLKYSVLTLSGVVIALLLYTLNWVRSADLGGLSPLLTVGGNLHPLLLHLPIGVFIYIGLSEAWNCIDRAFFRRWRIPGGLPILAFGTITAVLSALFGFLLYLQGAYSGELIERHMNWGTGFAIGTVVTLCSALVFSEKSQTYRFVLLLNITALTVAAHQGGLITHGDPLQPLFAAEEPEEEIPPVELLLTFDVVDKIFRANCYECHSVDTKKKGGLLMDSYAALIAGGKKGNALVPGSLEASKISNYVHLPLDHDLHMPPEGKPQPNEMEIRFIDEWILAGASPDTRLTEQGLSRELVTWGLNYMRDEKDVVEPVEAILATPKEPEIDFVKLISGIEKYAENSLSRVGPEGQSLVFSAVNARDTLNENVIEKLIPAGPYLIELDLANTAPTPGSIRKLLQSTTKLKRLNLSGMSIEYATLEPLLGLSTLESLNLFNATLAEDVFSLLRKMTQLRHLYIAGTGLSPEQVTQLKMALPACEIVGDYFLIRHRPNLPAESGN